MIKIGRSTIGFAQFSMIVLFIVLSMCAVIASTRSLYSAESSMPLSSILIINEGMALIATLIYGIFLHFILTIINRKRK